ncbi:hypothetical protein SLS55_003351 [Diplodia seriata]|uniref:Altered inheritance of mitochondria protein 24, mitochondrial n=1 Tax=Diplodia seriata TaxID=420778 RepID=A0ABR3CMR9_9PEZI
MSGYPSATSPQAQYFPHGHQPQFAPPPAPQQQQQPQYYPPPPAQSPPATQQHFAPPPQPQHQPQAQHQQYDHHRASSYHGSPAPHQQYAQQPAPAYPAPHSGSPYPVEKATPPPPQPGQLQQSHTFNSNAPAQMPGGAPAAGHFVGAGATQDDVGTFNGAMFAMSPTITLKGSIKFSLKKFVAGGELSTSTFTGPGELLLAPPSLGDITNIRLSGSEMWSVSKDGFLACTQGIVKEYKSQSLSKAMFSGEGLFVYKISGSGILWVTSMGAILRKDLQENEKYIVDNGHLVAWNCKYVLERVASGGVISNLSSGEGLVCKFTATGIIIQYWRPELNVGIWITVFAIPVLSINFFHVRVFGESQYIAGVVKLLVMTMLIISCLVASLKPVEGRGVVGFRYWKDSGAFGEYLKHGDPGRFLGFWAAFVQAGFAYIGTEVVGAAFGETPNVRKEVPRAIFWTFWRIVFFYIGGVVVLGMSCPYRNEMLVGATHSKASAAASPFVIAVKLAGFEGLPDVVNASLLVFVLSAACSGFDAFIYRFDASRFVTSYIGVLIFAANYYGWKLFAKTKWVKPKEMDLVNNCNIEPATETILLGQTVGLKD